MLYKLSYLLYPSILHFVPSVKVIIATINLNYCVVKLYFTGSAISEPHIKSYLRDHYRAIFCGKYCINTVV